MDKAQARILFLVLIGLLFFGQAVYDYIKKQKKSSTRRPSPQTKARNVRNTHTRPIKQSPLPKFDAWESDYNRETPVYDDTKPKQTDLEKKTQAEDNKAPSAVEADNDQDQAPNIDICDAIIWSEILKRKF